MIPRNGVDPVSFTMEFTEIKDESFGNYEGKMVGARGFELCPFTPNCPIFKELQNQRTNVHTLFTDSSEKPLKIIKTAEEEK